MLRRRSLGLVLSPTIATTPMPMAGSRPPTRRHLVRTRESRKAGIAIRYVIGDPVNGTDPSGLDTEETCDGGDGSDDDSGDCGAGGVMANSSTTNYSDSDVSGTYCTDSSGSSVSCDSPGAVLTATGPGNDGGTSTIASGASGVLDAIASLFGYDSQIPLPSCFGLFLTNTADGIVNLGSELKHWSYEERPVSLLRSSFPSRDHQLCRVGLPSLLPELPRCRGSSRRTRSYRLL
jgi:hypothetical protein